MAGLEKASSDRVFLSIVQGSLRQSVPEGTPDAVKRDWEAGGEKGTKYELVYKAITGRITKVDFFDGDSAGRKFQNINITVDIGADKPHVISVGVGTRYGQDIMKKLPNVQFGDEVRIRPYSFQPEGEDKTVTGVEITHKDAGGEFNKKVSSFFHKKEGDRWQSTNGFPVPEGDTADYTSDDWDIFYKQCRRFLVNYTKEHVIPKVESQEPSPPQEFDNGIEMDENVEPPADATINPDDIPF